MATLVRNKDDMKDKINTAIEEMKKAGTLTPPPQLHPMSLVRDLTPLFEYDSAIGPISPAGHTNSTLLHRYDDRTATTFMLEHPNCFMVFSEGGENLHVKLTNEEHHMVSSNLMTQEVFLERYHEGVPQQCTKVLFFWPSWPSSISFHKYVTILLRERQNPTEVFVILSEEYSKYEEDPPYKSGQCRDSIIEEEGVQPVDLMLDGIGKHNCTLRFVTFLRYRALDWSHIEINWSSTVLTKNWVHKKDEITFRIDYKYNYNKMKYLGDNIMHMFNNVKFSASRDGFEVIVGRGKDANDLIIQFRPHEYINGRVVQ